MISIGLIGFGTVGSGVYERIEKTKKLLEKRLGEEVSITAILVKHHQKERVTKIKGALLTNNPAEFLQLNFDVVFEAAGGMEPTKSYILHFLEREVPVITANKDLVAMHGKELEEVAAAHGVYFGYEAAVGGGIPIINSLRANLATTKISKVSGILNGTTNYILTEMNEKKKSFVEALANAQTLGYAEADPTNDVEGIDAWYKLRILSKLCFGIWPEKEAISCCGLTAVEDWQIGLAESLGLKLKLIAEATFNNGKVEGYVSPSFLAPTHPLAFIRGVTNAVCLEGDDIGELVFSGPGAGKEATSNSMVEDFVLLQKESFHRVYEQGLQNEQTDLEHTTILVFQAKGSHYPWQEELKSLHFHIESTFENEKGMAFLVKVFQVQEKQLSQLQLPWFPVLGFTSQETIQQLVI